MRVLSRQQAFDLIDQLSSPCFIQNNVVFWIPSCRLHFLKVTDIHARRIPALFEGALEQARSTLHYSQRPFQSRSTGAVHVHSLVSRPQNEPCKEMAKTPLEAFPVSSR